MNSSLKNNFMLLEGTWKNYCNNGMVDTPWMCVTGPVYRCVCNDNQLVYYRFAGLIMRN